MATPIVAGSLLLIRQYFAEGWYPAGVPNSFNSHTPSGPLMKAVLLGMPSLHKPVSRYQFLAFITNKLGFHGCDTQGQHS
jgi:hypothetical protein